MMITSICPNRETLFQYSVGTLIGEERDALDEHLESCPDCQATIMSLDDADDTVAGRLRTPPSSESFLAEPELHDALAMAMAMPIPKPGDKSRECLQAKPNSDMPETLGEYQLLEELGRGGMGRVYKALQTKLDRVVAVKILPRGRVGDRQAITRFEREMKAVGRLAHPNIVQAHDAREIDDTPVLIMEFVDGLDLAEMVRRLGPLPVADACELVRRTAVALQCAHEHGLVHRDIKPSNIMLARSGEVKLLDLGLARFYAEGGASLPPEEMTGTGQAMGTADYMAPEQVSDSRTVDIRADLYSLGCTLYKLVSGQAPFSGPDYRSTISKLNAHVSQPVPPVRRLVPDVPEKLVAILDRLLAKDPGDRFATPADVAAALEPFCRGANLPDLVERAMAVEESPLSRHESHSASPLSLRERVRVRAFSPFPRHPIVRRVLIGLAFLGAMGAAFAAGIVITIKKDGWVARLTVPNDANVDIAKNGDATVTLEGKQDGGKSSGASAAAGSDGQQAPAGGRGSGGSIGGVSPGAGMVPGIDGPMDAFRRDMGSPTGGMPVPGAMPGMMGAGGGGSVGGMPAPGAVAGPGGSSGGFYGGMGGRAAGMGGPTGGVRALGAMPGAGGSGGGFSGGVGGPAGGMSAQGTQPGIPIIAGMGSMSGGIGNPSGGVPVPGALRERMGLGTGGGSFGGGAQAQEGPTSGRSAPGGRAGRSSMRGGSPGGLSTPTAPKEVTVVHPTVHQVSHHVDRQGFLLAAQTAEVRSRVSGHLAKVFFKPGATVKQGDPLFELDPAPFQAAMIKPEAEVRLAQVRLERARAELRDASSPSDRRRLEAQQGETEAALQAAKGELDVARLNVVSTRITAPISGKIGRPLVPVGSLVTDSIVLATIDLVDPMGVAFDVNQETLLKLRRDPARHDGELGLTVLVGLSDEKGFPRKSKVESADTRLGPGGVARWQALLPNPDGLLMPGMTVHVRLITSDPYTALLVPESAVFTFYAPEDRSHSHSAVLIVTDRDVVQQHEVGIGERDDGDMLVVEKGLTTDDWVIENGNLRYNTRELKDGMTVKPQKKPPEVPPSSPKVAQPAAPGDSSSAKPPPAPDDSTAPELSR